MQDKIFNQYYDKLYYYSLNKTKNIEDAKDLVNDIFLAVFTYLNKNIKIDKIDNLIWTIASNCWKVKAKKYIKDKNIIYDNDIIENIEVEENDKLIYNEIIDNINNYNLNENELKCFKMYYVNNLSITEISNITNISSSNIKYYLYSSRNKIKEIYNEK